MRFFSVLLLIFSSTLVHAQEGQKVNCRFLCLDTNATLPTLLTTSANAGEISIKITAGAITESFPCFSKTATFSFLSSIDRKPVAEVKIPANMKSAVLVFLPSPTTSNALPWRIFAVEDSSKNFPNGGAFVANFHTDDIRFIIGENKLMLKPTGFCGVMLPTKRDAFNMAPVVFQFQQGENWRNASESMLRFLPGMHYLMFAFVEAASGRPRIVTFQDAKPPTPAGPLSPDSASVEKL